MKHGIYKIIFCGKPRFEVYVWVGQRKLGHIGTFRTEVEALQYFNENR